MRRLLAAMVLGAALAGCGYPSNSPNEGWTVTLYEGGRAIEQWHADRVFRGDGRVNMLVNGRRITVYGTIVVEED